MKNLTRALGRIRFLNYDKSCSGFREKTEKITALTDTAKEVGLEDGFFK